VKREVPPGFESLLNALPEPVALIDSTGKIITENRACDRLLRSAGVSNPFVYDTAPAIESLEHEEVAHFTVEVHEETESRYLAFSLGSATQTGCRCLCVREVTDEHRLQARLARSERLAAAGELAAGVAHNFNNILAGISAEAQLLRLRAQQEQLDSQTAEAAETIYRESMRGGQVARDLLQFAKGQDTRITEVDAVRVVGEAIRLARVAPGAVKVEFRQDFPDDLPFVLSDAGLLHQVALNILLNAVHAMPNGGYLEVRGRLRYDNGKPSHVEIAFEDSGVGIHPENTERIFEPFFSRRADGTQGAGLGLSISRATLRGMGGDITLQSQVGRGTIMTVILPISAQSG
jgi:signal transduction histidine kinase